MTLHPARVEVDFCTIDLSRVAGPLPTIVFPRSQSRGMPANKGKSPENPPRQPDLTRLSSRVASNWKANMV